jgi:hypothetical protein
MNHTCCFLSFSSPAFIRKPIRFPSGDHWTSETLSSPRVYCREAVAGPDVGTTHICVADFHGLSFSILFSATRYATREPSGAIRGENTRARRSASIVPNSFFPSLLLGAGASESSFSFDSCASTPAGAEAIRETANRIRKKQNCDFLPIIAHTPLL